MPPAGRVEGLGGQRLALGDQQLQTDQIQAGDGFGDGVFDLQAGVDLEEEEGPVGGNHELDRAGADIAERLGGGDRRRSELVRAGRRRGPATGDSSMIFW